MVAVVGQRVAELVSKLKAVLRPVSILSCQSNSDVTGWIKLKVDLRMIAPVVDVDAVELRPRAIPPKLKAGRLQHGRDISWASLSKSIRLHTDIEGISSRDWCDCPLLVSSCPRGG